MPRPPSEEAPEMRSGPHPAPPAGNSPGTEQAWWAARESIQRQAVSEPDLASRTCARSTKAVHVGSLVHDTCTEPTSQAGRVEG